MANIGGKNEGKTSGKKKVSGSKEGQMHKDELMNRGIGMKMWGRDHVSGGK